MLSAVRYVSLSVCAGLLRAWASLKWLCLLPLDLAQVQFEDNGVVAQDFQVPGNVAGAAVGCLRCVHA